MGSCGSGGNWQPRFESGLGEGGSEVEKTC